MKRRIVRFALGCAAIAFLVRPVGCVERSITIETDPPGATVWVNSEEKGKTPLTVPFTFYGTYEFRFELEGYQTVVVNEDLNAPAYQIFPLDLVTDVFLPGTLHDDKLFSYGLEKQTAATREDLLNRAKELRDEVNKYGAPTEGNK